MNLESKILKKNDGKGEGDVSTFQIHSHLAWARPERGSREEDRHQSQ